MSIYNICKHMYEGEKLKKEPYWETRKMRRDSEILVSITYVITKNEKTVCITYVITEAERQFEFQRREGATRCDPHPIDLTRKVIKSRPEVTLRRGG